MNKKTAASLFLGICLILAILLFTKTITLLTSSYVFAIALVVLGGLSRGFREEKP
jgi:uncharacterized membrane protein